MKIRLDVIKALRDRIDIMESKDMKFCRIFNQQLNREYSDWKAISGFESPFEYWFHNIYDHRKVIENTNKLNGIEQ